MYSFSAPTPPPPSPPQFNVRYQTEKSAHLILTLIWGKGVGICVFIKVFLLLVSIADEKQKILNNIVQECSCSVFAERGSERHPVSFLSRKNVLHIYEQCF